ncbi:hypothetical protein AQUCO_03500110v1 [Aquilegia coerulea]|uniref:ATP-dependent DNA helicase n=1 Tax=Aquilegia coerulea TaxID=218851 RepID=A0A2G5CW69_AQUCA|nr:hypothetical protein AQUCO_03500110v1 [Aquilegia coerulea]
MDVECSFCHALHWDGEKLSKSTRKKTLFGMCCLQGKIKRPPLSPLPPSIQSLYEGSDKISKSYRKNIRAYNASNAFTSLGVKMDDRILNGRGPKSFTIHGELCHNVGPLIPEIGKVPSYAQLYIYDSNSALDYRNKRNPQLREDVLKIIHETLLENNKLSKVYKHAYEVLKESNTDEDTNIPVWLHYKPDTDKKRYNLPTSEDIAVIMPGDGTEIASKRDIVLHLRGNKLKRISECHPAYLPLHYVLLFPNGDLDIVDNGNDPKEIGQRFILPSSHLGSPRHMYEIYQDSMAITRFNKHPDIFLTATANPQWPEIQNELKPFQNALDRPNLVARVFELKRKAIMKEIIDKQLFGKVVGYVYTIEFQKRGLPHMHALIFLQSNDKIKTTSQVDQFVCAEFPDPNKHPALFETVKKCMIHGPCGERNKSSTCMENGFCRSRFPRENADETKMDADGYPLYRRRKTGKVYLIRGQEVDNRDVVPYNPHLSEMFDSHINVEICASVRAVKYIHKYIYKGHDRATMVVGGTTDEIKQYIDARYVGSIEAAWRLLGNKMHKEKPSVTRLSLHLEGMHMVNHPEARCYTYQQFPEFFVWHKDEKMWTPRQDKFSIGRMYFANPNSGERFYLRLLLTVLKGPTSWADLKTFENVRYNSFKEACIARGLLEDDKEWSKCLDEAELSEYGKTLADYPNMPSPSKDWCEPIGNRLLWEHEQLQYEGIEIEAATNYLRLNSAQNQAYKVVTDSVFSKKGKLFFLNGAAGTGKTFVYNTIASACRSKGHIVVMVASSGIAALLLKGGRTAHSTFKIPLAVMEDSVCSIKKQSFDAELLRKTSLIIWDELPMQHRHCVEAVDRSLQDIRGNDKPFGGVTVVLGGDFRQTLPVIPQGSREEVVAASFRKSFLWDNVQVLNLVDNMRLNKEDAENMKFAGYLIQVGTNPNETIILPDDVKNLENLKDLVLSVYPQLDIKRPDSTIFLKERSILSARNDDVATINELAIKLKPGKMFEYLAADKVVDEGRGTQINGKGVTSEFLNSQEPASLPPFNPSLKIGTPIMLLRNISPRDGLCNGTRLMVVKCASRVIEAKILTGEKAGDLVFIPRITITPSVKQLAFQMSRRQFPIRLAYAMTINKSQGQSVKYIGIDLRNPVFSHGQLQKNLQQMLCIRKFYWVEVKNPMKAYLNILMLILI